MKLSLFTAPLFTLLAQVVDVEAAGESILGYTNIGNGICTINQEIWFDNIYINNIDSSEKCAEWCTDIDTKNQINQVGFSFYHTEKVKRCYCQYLDGVINDYSGQGTKTLTGNAKTADNMVVAADTPEFTCFEKDSPTKLPTKTPTKALSKTPTFAGAQGDPHFKTWSQKKFDFHGVCDLMMLSNEKFENNLGMDIHIRTKKMRMWSYISVLVIRIGNDILEVIGRNGGSYILNGIAYNGNINGALTLAGYPINYTKKSSKQQTFRLNFSTLEAIVIETWNSFVSVRFENPKSEHFKDSVGLLGSFADGMWLARDNVTIINDANTFGEEWQVLEHEANMFHKVEGPQQPLKKCEIPSNLNMRRLLSERTMTQNEAERACIGVDASSIDLCIFDVMATNSKLTSGAY